MYHLNNYTDMKLNYQVTVGTDQLGDCLFKLT